MFLRFFLYLVFFVFVMAIIISFILFVVSPFSFHKLNTSQNSTFCTHLGTGAKADIDTGTIQHPPFLLKASVQSSQMDLLAHFSQTLSEAKIPFWAVNTTLLAIITFGNLLPWDDSISIALEDDYFREFCGLRSKLENRGQALLLAGKHGYRYCMNNIPRFPFIDISLMKRNNHEVSICTPTDEIRECSFQDSFTRRREVFSIHNVFPLKSMTLGTLLISVPNNPIECLETRFGKNWKTLPTWSNWNFIQNANSRGLMQRLWSFH